MTRNPDRPRETLLVAIAASILVHAAAGVAFGRNLGAAPALLPLPSPPLSIRIANPAESAAAIPGAAPARLTAPENPGGAAARVESVAVAVTTAGPPETLPVPVAGGKSPQPVSGNAEVPRFSGGVTVTADATVDRAGRYLQEHAREVFPTEVWHPVRISEPIRVEYPAAALAAHREGTVVAFLVVAVDGTVAELDIVEGDDDFSLAVADALAKARLAPAEEIGGNPIPFWTVLEFNFHIDGAAAPAGTAVATPR